MWFRTTDMASPRTSGPSSTWGYSASQRFTLYPRRSAFRAARKTMQKETIETKRLLLSCLAGWCDWDFWMKPLEASFFPSFIFFGGEISHVDDPCADKLKLSGESTTYRYPIFCASFFMILFCPVLIVLTPPPPPSLTRWTASNYSHAAAVVWEFVSCGLWLLMHDSWSKHAFMQVISMHWTSTIIIIYLELGLSKSPSAQVETMTVDPYRSVWKPT